MKKLTMKDLRAITPYKVFGSNNTDLLRWLSYKLPNHRWVVYIGSHLLPDQDIIDKGNTLPKAMIKKVVNCDDDVLDRYKEGGEKNG